MENYYKKENPEYIRILCEIGTIESRIGSGIITNNKTLKYKKRDLKRLRERLKEINQFIETKPE